MPPAVTSDGAAGEVASDGRRIENRSNNVAGLRHPPRSAIRTGQLARFGADNADAARAQRLDIGDRRGVLPHLGVHRRSDEHGSSARKNGVAEKVVGLAGRDLGDRIGRSRRDNDDVCGLADGDVSNLVHTLVEVGVNRVAADCLKSGQPHELEGVACGHDVNVVASKHKLAHNRDCFIGSYSARNSDDNVERGHRETFYSPLSRLSSSLFSLISWRATERGLSSIVESTSGPTLSKRLPS